MPALEIDATGARLTNNGEMRFTTGRAIIKKNADGPFRLINGRTMDFSYRVFTSLGEKKFRSWFMIRDGITDGRLEGQFAAGGQGFWRPSGGPWYNDENVFPYIDRVGL